jgi:hypothetical protein
MLFGVFAGYERGTHQLTVSDDDDAEMLNVEQVAPPKTQANKRREFLEGVCYFGVFRNHVILAPSRALSAKPTEQHLNWLLAKAGVMGTNNRIALSEEIADATKERIRDSHVKEVEIGAPLFSAPAADQGEVKPGTKLAAFQYEGLGIDILRQVIGAEKMDKMKLADAIDGNIEVSLTVRYKRATTEKGHRVLDNIALAVRNLDEDDVRLKLADGSTVVGDEIKLRTVVSVEARDGVPNPDQLFEKMHTWLMEQIEAKVIEP